MAEILIKSIRVKNRYAFSTDPHTTGVIQNGLNLRNDKWDIRIDLYDAGKNKRIIRDAGRGYGVPEEWAERIYKKSDLKDIGIDIENDNEVLFIYLTGRINKGFGNNDINKRDYPCFPKINDYNYDNRSVLKIDRDFVEFFKSKTPNPNSTFSNGILPFFEIIEDPWTNKTDYGERHFGNFNGYYILNNKSKVEIKWSNVGSVVEGNYINGEKYSDNWGREIANKRDYHEIEYSDPYVTDADASFDFTREVIIWPPEDSESSQSFTLLENGKTFIEQRDVTLENKQKTWNDTPLGKSTQDSYEVREPDILIINEIISSWKAIPGNESLDIVYNLIDDTKIYLSGFNEGSYTGTYIDYISPLSNPTGSTGASDSGSTGATGATGASASGPSQSNLVDLYQPKELIFNTEKEGYLINSEYGEFRLVAEEEIGFSFEDDGYGDDSNLLQSELESEFAGEEELALIIKEPDEQLKDEIDKAGEEQDAGHGGTVNSSGDSIEFDHSDKKFKKPDVDKQYSETYNLYVDHTKMPAPSLTKKKLVEVKLKVEGGLTGDPSDSAAQKGYCPTPLSEKENKKVPSSSRRNDRKYHTNKGITYAVWKTVFGTGNDRRFLKMEHDDWVKVFDKLYWNKHGKSSKYESVNALIVSFAWGGSKDPTVRGAKRILGVDSLDAVSEKEAVAALLSARAQLFINISQPGNKNNKFRVGWINASNAFVKKAYNLS